MGKCELGSACRDYHGNMDLKKGKYKYKAEVCQAFLEGKCLLKDQICIKKHIKPEDLEIEMMEEIPDEIEAEKQEQNEKIEKDESKEEILKENEEKKPDNKEIVEVRQQKIG